MGRAAELKGLPSVLEREDESEYPLEALSSEETEEWQRRMKENLEQQMNCYFAQHLEEWELFLKGSFIS